MIEDEITLFFFFNFYKIFCSNCSKCTESGLQIDSLNQSEFIELIEYAIDNSLNDKMQCLSNEAPTWKKDWKNVFAVQECVISKVFFFFF